MAEHIQVFHHLAVLHSRYLMSKRTLLAGFGRGDGARGGKGKEEIGDKEIGMVGEGKGRCGKGEVGTGGEKYGNGKGQ